MKSRVYIGILALLTAGMGVWGYFHLPDIVPIHWNWEGEVDDYGSKYTILLGLPLIGVILYIMRSVTPNVDPRKENYAKFQGSYEIITNAILTFLVVIYGILILNGSGYQVPINLVMPLLVGILFLILGNYMQRVKPNYFIGVRTPWALQNEEVWRYTHRIGARMFVAAGMLLIIAAFAPNTWKIVLFITAIAGAVVVPFAASYLYYKKLSN